MEVEFKGGRIWSDKDTEERDHTNPSVQVVEGLGNDSDEKPQNLQL